MMKYKQVAFMSYAHNDDTYDNGAITELARKLERALRAFTGEALEVFIDRNSIQWGDAWKACIAQGLVRSTVLIAIVTPTYLRSQECQNEIDIFFSETGIKREQFFLPVYYLEIEDLNARTDRVSQMCAQLQYEDWRELRTTGRTTITWRKAIERLAKRILNLLQSGRHDQQSDFSIIQSEPSRDYRAQPRRLDAKDNDWIDYALVATAACDKEEYGLARALLLDALESTRNGELLYELAIVDWMDGALDAAISEFQQALAAGLDRVTVLQGLGQARVERGDFETGIKDLTTVIEHHPDDMARAYARSTRALGLGGIGHFDEALDELVATERMVPENAWVQFNRARILDWQNDPAAAQYYLCSLVLNSPPLNRPKREMAQRRLRELRRAGGVSLKMTAL